MNLSEIQKINTLMMIQELIEKVDEEIAVISSENNAKIIKEHFSFISEFGSFRQGRMWDIKKKLHLKKFDYPTAKCDKSGNLITSKSSLLSLYEKEYIERLSPKTPWAGYEDLHSLNENLFKKRFFISSKLVVKVIRS